VLAKARDVVRNDADLGRQLAAITSFITVHEVGHAFVDLFHLPIAGSSAQNMQQVASFDVLSPARVERCPDEYQSKASAWKTLLAPHVRK
jgi:hypothetical protein